LKEKQGFIFHPVLISQAILWHKTSGAGAGGAEQIRLSNFKKFQIRKQIDFFLFYWSAGCGY